MSEEGKVSVHDVGAGGVQLTKDPLQLEDNEATQLQNAEYVLDSNTGGLGALSKRGGLAIVNGTPLNGGAAITGLHHVPLLSNIVRRLYASLGDADSDTDTWLTSTNGTSWVATSALDYAAPDTANYRTVGSFSHVGVRRAAALVNRLIYISDNYTSDLSTPANNTAMPIHTFDGTTDTNILDIPRSSRATSQHYAFSVTDMLVADGILYLAVHDPANSAGTLRGRVLSLDLVTGVLHQVAEAFSAVDPDEGGGAPVCLHWFQGQLWVGLDQGVATNGAARIMRCYPGVDSVWTADKNDLQGYASSIVDFRGDLYLGLRGTTSNDAAVFKRASAGGAYASSDTVVTVTEDYYSSLIVYNDELYAVVYSDDDSGGTTLIRKFDGSSWTTDRNVATSDNGGLAIHPGQPCVFGGALFYTFRSSTPGAADGFILRKSGGTWTKVATDNINGRLVQVVERT